MKCNPQRTIDNMRHKQYEEQQKKEKEYYNSLSEEEKAIYDENKRKRQEEAVRLFGSLYKVANQLGVNYIYKEKL